MMLSKTVKPKTKTELLRSIQEASFRSFDVLEGSDLDRMPAKADLARRGASVIVLWDR